MERVAFLDEDTGTRIPALLNPNSVVVRRAAPVRRAASASGFLTSADLDDDPVVVSGGGRTELELDLLFDTSLVPLGATPGGDFVLPPGAPAPVSTTTAGRPAPNDVRELTGPLWRLSERSNRPAGSGSSAPPLVRFVWGKAWNVLGVVAEVSERLEQFGPDGAPARSWLRMRLLRVPEPDVAPEEAPASPSTIARAAEAAAAAGPSSTDGQHEVIGDERVDEVAARAFGGRPWLWRLLAATNGIDDPPFLPPGTVLRVPEVPPMDPGPRSREP